MKKILTLTLIIVLFLAFTGYTVRAEMRLTTSLKETQYVDGVRHTKIVGQLEYDGVVSNQVINYLGANVQN